MIEGRGTFQIEELIVNDVGHWYVINGGPSINNAGQLAVWAHNPTTGQAGTLLLTPRAEIAPLTDFTVSFGTLLSGTLDDLRESDNLRVVAQSRVGFTANEPYLTDLRIGAQSPMSSPAFIDLAIEGRLNQPGGTARIRMRNWSTNSLELLHQYPIGNDETTETIPDIDATNRVRSSDGRIELSLRQSVLVTFSASGFRSLTDRVGVAVR